MLIILLHIDIVAIESRGNTMSGITLQFIDAGIGDCILVTDLTNDKKVLIDSGPSKGEGRISVSTKLEEILDGNNKINLAIVTHNDDDHIGGFKNLLENEIINVDKFLFNSVESFKEYSVESKKSSYRQDVELQALVHKMKIETEVLIVDEHETNQLIIGDIKLKFISPNRSKIDELQAWSIKEQKRIKVREKSSDKDVYENLDEAINSVSQQDKFDADKSPTNGSSFAFILEYGCRKFLFLGDSHMDIIEEYLDILEEPLKLELVKLSHHSSKKNNSMKFFNNICCEQFVFCSDGLNNNDHPSLTTVARLSINFPYSKLFFTSESDEIKDFSQSFSERCVYPKDNVLEFSYEL